MMTDPIADMLTRIRNANKEFMSEITMPSSRMKMEIAKILKEEGYITDYVEASNGQAYKILKLQLRYLPNRQRVITGIKRISRPGLRVYVKNDEIPRVLGGLGNSIISTSRGIITGANAKKNGLGGEVLCYIW